MMKLAVPFDPSMGISSSVERVMPSLTSPELLHTFSFHRLPSFGISDEIFSKSAFILSAYRGMLSRREAEATWRVKYSSSRGGGIRGCSSTIP